jgi:hypothetical protein
MLQLSSAALLPPPCTLDIRTCSATSACSQVC